MKSLEVDKEQVRIWWQAIRPGTLFISFSTIMASAAVAQKLGDWSFGLFLSTSLVTLLLQIASNLANDLGDDEKGVDKTRKLGSERLIASGKLSRSAVKRMLQGVLLMVVLVGAGLLYRIYQTIDFTGMLLFFIVGIGAMVAAITYTMGKTPYGYRGFGDFFAFLFFGPVAVWGSGFLYSESFESAYLLPGIVAGILSASILNLNNMRDIENDRAYGKITFAGILGGERARLYHLFINGFGLLLLILQSALFGGEGVSIDHFLFILLFPFYIALLLKIRKSASSELQPYFKKSTLWGFLVIAAWGLNFIWA